MLAAPQITTQQLVQAHTTLLTAADALIAWDKTVMEHHPRYAVVKSLFESKAMRPSERKRLADIVLVFDASEQDEEWSDIDDKFIEF